MTLKFYVQTFTFTKNACDLYLVGTCDCICFSSFLKSSTEKRLGWQQTIWTLSY